MRYDINMNLSKFYEILFKATVNYFLFDETFFLFFLDNLITLSFPKIINREMSTAMLIDIQNQINFYGYPILLVIGVIGNIFILILFNKHKDNACSIYLMNSS